MVKATDPNASSRQMLEGFAGGRGGCLLVGDGGMAKKMETTIVGYLGFRVFWGGGAFWVFVGFREL